MMVINSEALLLFFEEHVGAVLRGQEHSPNAARIAEACAAAMFRELKSFLDPARTTSRTSWKSLCDQRRQLAHQARLHGWLHARLCVHLPLSVRAAGADDRACFFMPSNNF